MLQASVYVMKASQIISKFWDIKMVLIHVLLCAVLSMYARPCCSHSAEVLWAAPKRTDQIVFSDYKFTAANNFQKSRGLLLIMICTFIVFFFIFQLQLSFPRLFIVASGTCVYFESSPAHVPAVPGTLIADCFTQIRWELSFVKECLSLTIMMIPSLWPRCKCRVSTCISQIVWFKKQTSALKGKKKKRQAARLSSCHNCALLAMVGLGLH